MKLVVATPLYPPDIGGPATYVKLLEKGLPSHGIEVTIVKFGDVRHLPNALRQMAFAMHMYRAAKKADMILALDAVSVGWPTYFANIFLRKKLILKIVGDHIWEQGRQRFGITSSLDEFPRLALTWHPYLWFLRILQFIVARGADKIIVPSYYLKAIVRGWGVRGSRIEVIPNAVPVGTPGSVPENVRTLPRPRIVTAGRLVPWKHIEGIIDAVQLLHKESTSVCLAIVGDGPERAALEKRAKKLGSVCEFTGQLSHEDTLAVIASADVFVLNSSYEGFSHLLVEALSLGVPVIATEAGGNDEIIEDGGNGLLVPVGNVRALTNAMDKLLLDVEFARKVRSHARSSVAQFSPEAVLSATAAFLSSL